MQRASWSIVVSSAFIALESGAAPLIGAAPDATLPSNQDFVYAGQSVAGADVNGDGYSDVIVGASSYDAGQVDEGAAFIFLGGPAGIVGPSLPAANTVLQGNQASGLFGKSVASAGDVNGDGYDDVIVGAYYFDAGQADEGVAFVYHGGPSGIPSGSPATAQTALQGDQSGSGMGLSVASAGDVNADGYDDVLVGAAWYAAGHADEGAAFVFLGSASGVASAGAAGAASTFQTNQTNARIGSVASAGDVNGDGYDDVIYGSHQYDLGEDNEGAVFVFHGGPAGIPSGNPLNANATLQGNQVEALFGWRVAGAGDVNRDGYADVVVGAFKFDSGQLDEGAAFVFHGSAGGIANGSPVSANAMFQSDQVEAEAGNGVAGVGDVTGDGYDDVLVGAPAYDAGQASEGAVFVLRGGPTGVAGSTPASVGVITLQSNVEGAGFGEGVGAAGDVNGDGHADVVVGAPFYEAGESDEGAAFVYLGGFVKGDIDRDLKTDLVLRNTSNQNIVWIMNGVVRTTIEQILPTPFDVNRRIAGIDDFNGNLHNDLLIWNQATGATDFWPMLFHVPFGPEVPLSGAPTPPWKPSATADFNHDGKPDIVWRNFSTQNIAIWLLNGMTLQSVLLPTPNMAVDGNWEIAASLDWNGDKHTDFLWYNATSGKIVLWFMDANAVRITGLFTNPPNAGDNNWNVVAAGDYGVGPGGLPGTKDIVWRNATSGNIVVWYMDKAGNRTSGTFTAPTAPTPGPTSWTVVGPR